MAKPKKPVGRPPDVPDPFKGKNGYDLMAGPKVFTRPTNIKPPLIPGTGMGMGMSYPE